MVATPLKSAKIMGFLLPCGVATGGMFATEAGFEGRSVVPLHFSPHGLRKISPRIWQGWQLVASFLVPGRYMPVLTG